MVEARRYKPEGRWHKTYGCTMALGSTQSPREMSNRNIFSGGKGGRSLGLTKLPSSYTDCLEIWEPQPPGKFRACPGLLYFYLIGSYCWMLLRHISPLLRNVVLVYCLCHSVLSDTWVAVFNMYVFALLHPILLPFSRYSFIGLICLLRHTQLFYCNPSPCVTVN